MFLVAVSSTAVEVPRPFPRRRSRFPRRPSRSRRWLVEVDSDFVEVTVEVDLDARRGKPDIRPRPEPEVDPITLMAMITDEELPGQSSQNGVMPDARGCGSTRYIL